MKRNLSGKPDSRNSQSTLTWVLILVIYPALIVLACIPLFPLFALVRDVGLIADRIGTFLGLVILLATTIPYLIWLFLIGEWSLFVEVLKELLRCLRSIGQP